MVAKGMKSDPRLIGISSRRVIIPVCLVVYRVRLIDFPDHLVVNWTYSSRRLPRSSRRRRVRLVDSPDRLIVIRLVASEFVLSTHETDSARITPLQLIKCRVRLIELWDRLVVS